MHTMKKWLKISIEANPLMVEVVSDYLVGIHGAGVDLAADKDENPAGQIVAFIEQAELSTADAEKCATQISVFLAEMAAVFNVASPSLVWEFLEEEDWSKNWKEHFVPFTIVPGLIIAPTWENYEAQGDELVIEMDPGMAFGTGHHATTSLSLSYLQDVVTQRGAKTVLDVGCGTGILVMGAVLFGAERGLGIDNCPDAVAAASNNVVHNHLAEKIDIGITPLSELREEYDLVVANIIHDVLASMVLELYSRVKKEGHLILSGLLADQQVDSIIEIFAREGFVLLEKGIEGEWGAVLLQKR
ncbi:50S ribosomal protein L11 methyltransferase [Desulfotalea psychrophila]|uniref:Ribosomal protein L11 methyltransferase n=1 Tax=Desulfotalea psychrophila (strain LSv54 / DSM 12343) TaxID=177439 RepID=PRMA_DESPS|nr:50S ribosomal protein L11 methyltransferase [Desulfotalea psychrophila]Q6AQF1.1 RecName: Full=Ribosomal protein L11 methyltransferase; Short=L11 Mtase [Desulfotalea psychrophila LSv54]CAG35422.1 related to methyltransferase [Desulfotalea psychrophila LSv54]